MQQRFQINLRSDRHSPIRVAIDAQMLPSQIGGVASALLALVRALANLTDSNDTYHLVVGEEEADFWRREAGPNQTIVPRKKDPGLSASGSSRNGGYVSTRFQAIARQFLRKLRARLTLPKRWPEVPLSDGFYESLGCDVLHLPSQRFTLSALPTVYNPHDLQHLHMPQFFSAKQLAWRETVYPVGCRVARVVVVGSHWAKDDFVRNYGLDPAKLQVIPEGSSIQLSAPIETPSAEDLRSRYSLPEKYLLYSAISWPHKNHVRLLEALALLREDHGITASLVLTGTRHNLFWPQVEKRIRELRLEQQVHHLGFIPEADLRTILRSAQCLIHPSLFEASSLPIYDAWLEGVPVACSRATALPEQVADAALLFDPLDPVEIAGAIAEIVSKPDLRADLRARGYRRLKDFDWTRTAKCYRAVYRRAANAPLTEEDRWLLQWDWMREPNKRPDLERIR